MQTYQLNFLFFDVVTAKKIALIDLELNLSVPSIVSENISLIFVMHHAIL